MEEKNSKRLMRQRLRESEYESSNFMAKEGEFNSAEYEEDEEEEKSLLGASQISSQYSQDYPMDVDSESEGRLEVVDLSTTLP